MCVVDATHSPCLRSDPQAQKYLSKALLYPTDKKKKKKSYNTSRTGSNAKKKKNLIAQRWINNENTRKTSPLKLLHVEFVEREMTHDRFSSLVGCSNATQIVFYFAGS